MSGTRKQRARIALLTAQIFVLDVLIKVGPVLFFGLVLGLAIWVQEARNGTF
jgi:hypothetical protein